MLASPSFPDGAQVNARTSHAGRRRPSGGDRKGGCMGLRSKFMRCSMQVRRSLPHARNGPRCSSPALPEGLGLAAM
eukprot:4787956-Alexandrium_andersonii.AAC.1